MRVASVSRQSSLPLSVSFIVIALRTGEIAVVAPFRYVAAPLSVAVGYWWWGDMPDALAFIGIGLVVAAGLYILHRERHGLTSRPLTGERSPAQ